MNCINEKNIRVLKNGNFQVRFGGKSKTFLNRADAIILRDSLLSDTKSPPKKEFADSTLSECLPILLHECSVMKEYSPQYMERAKRSVHTQILPKLGKIVLRNLTEHHVSDLIVWLMDHAPKGKLKRSAKTVKNEISTFQQLLSYAQYKGYLATNPCEGASRKFKKSLSMRSRRSVQDTIRKRALPARELLSLIKTTEEINRSDAFLIQFLARTGLRIGEASALLWSDVSIALDQSKSAEISVEKTRNDKTGLVQIGAKSGSNGISVLEGDGVLLLTKWSENVHSSGQETSAHANVFPFLSARGAQKAFSFRLGSYGKRAKIRHVSAHSLRHTFGTLAAVSGANLSAIQAQMRHKTVTMTQNYIDSAAMPLKGVSLGVDRLIRG